MIHSGTPDGVPVSFDCAVRKLAYEYGKETRPERGDFRTLFEALQLQHCDMKTPAEFDHYTSPDFGAASATTSVFVSLDGKDTNDGTMKKPFASIARAVDAVKGKKNSEILLRAGSYFVPEAVNIGSESAGLTIRNYKGEDVEVTGGVAFTIPKSAWEVYKQEKGWDMHTGMNNVYGTAQAGTDTNTVKYMGTFDNIDDCKSALDADKDKKGPFQAFTYHHTDFDATFGGQCFGRTDVYWSPHKQSNVDSGYYKQQNVWRADVSSLGLDEMPGLRLNGKRAIRAKYPNGDPEQSGLYLEGADAGTGYGGDYVHGWVPLSANTEWVKPARKPDAESLVITADDWPSVEWPMSEDGGSRWTGEGAWGEYHLGMGGYCDDLDPPIGYWCSMDPPRGQCWDKETNEGSGCTQTHMSPDGMVFERAKGYADPTGAVVQSWRGGGRWFTQQWLVESFDSDTNTLNFDPTTGHQGGEGMTSSGQWWIENVKEECDDSNEWFFDAKEQMLYFNPNTTDALAGPNGDEEWVVPLTRVLFNVSGSQQDPVKDVTIKGITIRDTRHTYLEPRGMPSGGDWTLQRIATMIIEGTEGFQFTDSFVTNIDGNGVGINGYNRNATIARNEFSWIGDSAMFAWGYTGNCLNEACTKTVPYKVGPDGRGGEQPWGTVIADNIVREIGIWQKQSSMWFQAVTAETLIERNVHFNGPRAGINLNDGFGGGDIIKDNLLLNCVRESGDHGPVNSWDRVPYITTFATGKPSIVPKFREFVHNFFVATYSSQQAIDNDDGSCYYSTHDNFFVYGANGVKADFGGQYNLHNSNVYAYVGACWGEFGTDGSGSHNEFNNNKCIALSESGGFHSDCAPKVWFDQIISGNSIYNSQGKFSVDICEQTNTVAKWPADDDLIAMARKVLSTERDIAPTERHISVKADGKLWRANDDDDKIVSAGDTSDDYSIFVFEEQVDGSYRIRVKADGQYLHVDGLGDELLSTRFQSGDEYTRFFLESLSDGLWRLKLKATGKYLHASDLDDNLVSTRFQTNDDYSKFVFTDAASQILSV